MAVLNAKDPIEVIGAILAGGKSRRMGTDKTRLKIGESNLLEHARHIFSVSKINTVLISHPAHIPDRIRDCGPLGGIDAILDASKEICSHVVFMPIDMPMMKPSLLRQLYSPPNLLGLLKTCDPVIAAVRFSQFVFPFRLANTPTVRDIVKARLDQGRQLSLMALQSELECLEINIPDSQNTAFTNLNSPEDWKRLNLSEKPE
jgi:molybdopterin-guanine dinucleotide biosynthesis protein A